MVAEDTLPIQVLKAYQNNKANKNKKGKHWGSMKSGSHILVEDV